MAGPGAKSNKCFDGGGDCVSDNSDSVYHGIKHFDEDNNGAERT